MVGFPLLLIPLAIYNIIVFLMPDVSFTDPLVKLTLMSGAEWTVTLSDVLLALAILLLLAEVIKGARPGAKYLTDHLLSLIVFGAAAAEFVLWPKFGYLDLFPADGAGAGGFPLRPCLANAAPCRCGSGGRAPLLPPPKAAEKVEAPAAEPQIDPCAGSRHPRLLRPRCRRPPRSPNPCCRITPSRNRRSPPSRPRRLRSCREAVSRNAFPGSLVTGSPVTGDPVAGTAAGLRLAAIAGQPQR